MGPREGFGGMDAGVKAWGFSSVWSGELGIEVGTEGERLAQAEMG